MKNREKDMDLELLNKLKTIISDQVDLWSQIDQFVVQLHLLQKSLWGLGLDRFSILSKTLKHISSSMGKRYRQLTESSDCYLSYPHDVVSLFAEGIMVMSRSGDTHWKEVVKLIAYFFFVNYDVFYIR